MHKIRVTPDWETDTWARNPELQGQKFDVYQTIRDNPYITRGEVAKLLGLKSSTATARIKELIDAGLVIEPPHRKKSAQGVRVKTLVVSDTKEHKLPRDRVRVELSLMVDESGHYHARAEVVDGARKIVGFPRIVSRKEITLIAPYPNEYYHLFSDEKIEEIPPEDTAKNLNLIVDGQ